MLFPAFKPDKNKGLRLPQRRLSTDIAFIISAGLLLSLESAPVQAQTPQFNCQPNAAGDGWVCEQTGPGQRNTQNLSFPATAPEPESEPTAESIADDEAADSGLAANAAARTDTTSIETVPVNTELDWLPRAAMTPAQEAALAPYCCGAFIDPLAGQNTPENDPANAEMQFQAASGLTQISQNLFDISGDIVVNQGYRQIRNDQSTSIDRGANTLLMEGNVEFREPGLLLTGDSAFIDSEANINRLESANYVIHDFGAHGTANSIVYNAETGLVTIENGEFSRCEPGNEFWSLRADSFLIDQDNNRGYARNVSLRLGDVPIFYYPFTLPFPLGDERISGILAPSTGSTRTGGFDFELPYYLNLAPHYDATIAPRLISDRGVMASAEFRYLSSWSMNTVNMSHLAGDDLFDPASKDIPGTESPPVADRWFIGYDHQGRLGQNWSTYVDYNAVSDADYFYDLGSTGLNVTSQTHLNRQGRLDYRNDWLHAGVNVQRIQIIDPFAAAVNIYKPYDRMPQFHFSADSFLGGGFRIGVTGQVTSFDRELDANQLSMTQIDNGALVTGERINLEPELAWSLETPGWFLRTAAKYRYAEYRLQNQALLTEDNPDIAVPVYSADTGLIFERDTDGGSQTLEPRLFYLYSEFEDQSDIPLFDSSELNFSFNQLFRDDRFSGGDRSGDADQLTAAITSRLLDERGRERARFSLGQIFYFADRQVSLSNPLQNWTPRYSALADESALAGEIALRIGESWRINTDAQWNQNREELDEGSLQLRYQRDNNRLFNLAYRYRRLSNSPNFMLPAGIDPRIKQTDVSAVWPVNENWTVLGRWNYDLSNERNLESFAGLQWRNCCATIRLVAREWVDENELFLPNSEPNRGIFVQFTLNGLGNIAGGGLSTLLEDSIWGFRDTEFE